MSQLSSQPGKTQSIQLSKLSHDLEDNGSYVVERQPPAYSEKSAPQVRVSKTPDYLIVSCVVMWVCNFPIGLAAVICSYMGISDAQMGLMTRSRARANIAMILSIVGVLVTVLVIMLTVLIVLTTRCWWYGFFKCQH